MSIAPATGSARRLAPGSAGEKNSPPNTSGRLYGIDCLRLLSMIGVVTLHVLGHGGSLAIAQGATREALWLVETICYPAVDVFVLMSGYLSSRRITSHARRMALLWAQAIFYGAVVTLSGLVLGYLNPSFCLALQVVSPLSHRTWWFLSDFVAATLMFPFVDTFLQQASKRSVQLVALSVFGMLSVVGTICHFVTSQDSFTLHLGYSSMWLVALYALGSFIRRLETDRVRPSLLLAAAIPFVALTWWWKLWGGPMASGLLGHDVSDVLLAYTSPTVLVPAVCLVALFAQAKIVWGPARSVLEKISPLALGVYLLSDHPMTREWFVVDRFSAIADQGPVGALPHVAAAVLMIFVAGLLADWLRQKLFDLAGVTRLIDRLASCFKRQLSSHD